MAAQAPPTVELSSSINPARIGQAVTLSARVDAADVSGTITFLDGTAILGTRITDASGQATLTTAMLQSGSHRVRAVYRDSAFASTTSQVLVQNVRAVPSSGLAHTSDLAVGLEPAGIAAADFNGDGRTDLAVVNSQSYTVSILLGSGDGTFAPACNYPAGTYPTSLAVGDLNGDGNTDIVTANWPGDVNTVTVLLGNGDGTFAPKVSYAAGSTPFAVAIGDFNSDGRADVAVTNYPTAPTVTILSGNGDGTFGPPVSYPAGNAARAFALSDFNGDNRTDVAVTDYANAVTVLQGQADGSFTWPAPYSVGNGPRSIAAGDFNSDGYADLAVANENSMNVSVLLGAGNGAFTFVGGPAAGNGPYSVAAGDFDGDGHADLVTANYYGGNVSILRGWASGTFAGLVTYATGLHPASALPGDFNGDGRTDLAVVNSGDNSVSIFLAQAPAATATALTAAPNPAVLGTPVTLTATVTPAGATGKVTFMNAGTVLGTVTVDASGQAVLVTRLLPSGRLRLSAVYGGNGSYASSTSMVLEHTINALPSRDLQTSTEYYTGPQPMSVVVSDFDIDGCPDVASVDADGPSSLGVFLGRCDGTFDPGQYNNGGVAPNSVAAGDLNGDGFPDLAIATASSVRVSFGNGAGLFSGFNRPAGNEPRAVAIGDFNSDGRPDLAVANYQSNDVSVLLGDGSGFFAPGSFVPAVNLAARIRPTSVALGDFNADGRTDLVVTNGGSNDISVFLGIGGAAFAPPVTYAAGSGPSSVTVGDFNNDGRDDLAVANSTGHGISVYLGNGDGTFADPVNYVLTASPFSIVTGDLNGDGYPDLAAANGDSVALLAGTGDGTFAAPVYYPAGNYPYALATGDFNLDGRIDLAVTDKNLGRIEILLGLPPLPPPIATSVTLSAAPIPAMFGQPVTLTAEVAPASATGSVLFLDGISIVGSAQINASSRATLTTVLRESGTRSLRAVYSGDATHGSATSASVSMSVQTRTANGFLSAVTYAAGATPFAVASGDFNGDGQPDLAVTNLTAGTVNVLLGNGNGTFRPAVTFPAFSDAASLTVGDFNEDGRADLAIATCCYVKILLGHGDGTFTEGSSYADGTNLFIVSGDFNRDGHADLAVATNGPTASIWLGKGDGTFLPAIRRDPMGTPQSIVAGDFNRDGIADLASADFFGKVLVQVGGGDGTFLTTGSYSVGPEARAIATGDVNDDGIADLVASLNPRNLVVLLGRGDGTFTAPATILYEGYASSIAVTDLNGDGRMDLAVSGASGVTVLPGRGDGTFAPPVTYAAGNSPWGLVIGDFNGDGRPDMAVTNYGSGTLSVFTAQAATGSVGDLDGDGKQDLVWQNDATRQVTVNYHGGAGGAALVGWAWLNASGAPGWRVVGAADFDGSGTPDLVWQSEATRQVTVNYYGGAGGAALVGWAWLNASGAPGWTVVGVADVDGNGSPDLVWQNDTTRQVTVNYYGGAGGATLVGWAWLNSSGAPGWRVAGAGDFDGNGTPDLAWQNDTTRQVTVNYYGGAGGATLVGWAWLNSSGAPGWRVLVPSK